MITVQNLAEILGEEFVGTKADRRDVEEKRQNPYSGDEAPKKSKKSNETRIRKAEIQEKAGFSGTKMDESKKEKQKKTINKQREMDEQIKIVDESISSNIDDDEVKDDLADLHNEFVSSDSERDDHSSPQMEEEKVKYDQKICLRIIRAFHKSQGDKTMLKTKQQVKSKNVGMTIAYGGITDFSICENVGSTPCRFCIDLKEDRGDIHSLNVVSKVAYCIKVEHPDGILYGLCSYE